MSDLELFISDTMASFGVNFGADTRRLPFGATLMDIRDDFGITLTVISPNSASFICRIVLCFSLYRHGLSFLSN